tara:strand:+ start:306 stop:527 length:222 start_codon:yes stop_codon:yes gene_type:complete
MKNLTIPQAILFGLGLIALAIVISSYSSSSMIKEARADAAWLSNIDGTLKNGNSQVVRALNDISQNIRKYCGS